VDDNMSIIKSFSVGEGDMFYIKHGHGCDSFTIIDCCMSEQDRTDVVKELKSESKNKGVTRFISTHPDDDHFRGLAYLNENMPIRNFYCVKNEATKPDETDDFDEYCALRDDSDKAFYLSRGCSRKWLNRDDNERGRAGINILWPITSNEHYKEALKKAKDGESFNNISSIVKYSLNGGATMLWMGDLEADFMEKIKDEITMDTADILFAPHHGRDSGKVPADWLKEMNPEIVIIGEAPSEDLNYYEGYNTITQNSAGDITLECVSGKTHIYVSNENYSVDFLDDENLPDTYGKYIGTLKV
jgi:beta-lactamase superfamily II metal-dependent hydrolase